MIRGITAGLIALFVAMAVVFVARADRRGPDDAPGLPVPAMAGSWSGEARIVVNWTTEKTLRVTLNVAPDGRVTGTIGDAVLRDGSLESNRTAIGRALHLATDWIVRGTLDGDVIKAEGIRRATVKIPLDWVDGHFEGGVNTSGSHLGGKDTMWLAAQDLRLDRVKVRQ